MKATNAGFSKSKQLVSLLFLFGSSAYAMGPITISSDADFQNCGCVVSGSGSKTDPYVIGPFNISPTSGYAVTIDGTNLTKSFKLYNLAIGANNNANGILLKNINSAGNQTINAFVSGSQTAIQHTQTAITVKNSNYVTLDGGGASLSGIGVVGGNAMGSITHNTVGAINVENSGNITIKGWQLSANGTDAPSDWVNFNPDVKYWGVGGVRFYNVKNSLIDHNAANNDVNLSFGLFNSSNNTISNNTADYPFPINVLIADGSQNNTVQNNDMGTSDFIGLLIADPLFNSDGSIYSGPVSSYNMISNNIIHTNGPIGNERHTNISPAFLGGIVVLNGVANNTIKNNQSWGNTGPDMVWAQAVVNSDSPIGIAYYPPTVDCNLSSNYLTSPPFNGNNWVGNTITSASSCIPAQ